MSAIISSIIQRKAGQASHYIEAGASEGGTTGHSAAEGGLRGHSIGATWPYRVVVLGSGAAELYRLGQLVCTCKPNPYTQSSGQRCAGELAMYYKWCEDPANPIQLHFLAQLPVTVREARTANALAQQPIVSGHINHPGAC